MRESEYNKHHQSKKHHPDLKVLEDYSSDEQEKQEKQDA